MEPDMDVSFDLYWQTPHLIFEPQELVDLGAIDSVYAPADDSLSGLYSSYDGSSSPDGASSCLTAVAAGADDDQPSPGTKTKNIKMEKDRRRRLNDKLYALRGVVPNITKMDKASIIRDAIAYIEQLQEQERRMLAEVSTFTAAFKAENLFSTGEATVEEAAVGVSSPERKKMRRTASASSMNDALCSPTTHPVEILELQVSEIGDTVAVINLKHYKTRDAMVNVCRALDSLRLKVISASVTTVASSTVHTLFVECRERAIRAVNGVVRLILPNRGRHVFEEYSKHLFNLVQRSSRSVPQTKRRDGGKSGTVPCENARVH